MRGGSDPRPAHRCDAGQSSFLWRKSPEGPDQHSEGASEQHPDEYGQRGAEADGEDDVEHPSDHAAHDEANDNAARHRHAGVHVGRELGSRVRLTGLANRVPDLRNAELPERCPVDQVKNKVADDRQRSGA